MTGVKPGLPLGMQFNLADCPDLILFAALTDSIKRKNTITIWAMRLSAGSMLFPYVEFVI